MFSKIKGLTILVTTAMAACTLSGACVSYKKRPARLYRQAIENRDTFDALIVPGIPFYDSSWDSLMKGRVLWSYILYRQGIVRNIIYSGGAVYSPYYESGIMGLYGHALGIPLEHIFLIHWQSTVRSMFFTLTGLPVAWVLKALL